MKKLALFCAVWVAFFLSGCDKNRVYEKNKDFDGNNWKIADVQEFPFEIKDASKAYNIYFNIRNANFYEYYNLYLKHTLVGPDNKVISTNLHETFLMDKKTGEPLGNGSGDIFDHQILALKNQHFPKTGTYIIKLQQYMRRDPLPGIMSVGVRVEKAQE
jgi:gliding motility-associated lipoprotein GldH